MRSRAATILFTLFAPITLPAYLIFLGLSNLLGGAFYIVIEATAAKLLRRPISLTAGQMALLALPVLAVLPFVAAGHMLLWLLRTLAAWLIAAGHWQAATRSRAVSFVLGTIWVAVGLWATVTCLNAAVGASWVGQGVTPQARDYFVEHVTKHRFLGEMPEPMQARRRVLITELETYQDRVHPRWEIILQMLRDDESSFQGIRSQTMIRRLTGLPWYFNPAEVAEDGLDHSELMLGPIIFIWMLLIRWPGIFRVLRFRSVCTAWFAARVGLVAWSIYSLITWEPIESYYGFWFEPNEMTTLFALLSPAHWLGFPYIRWVRPEWYLFNAGLWMLLVGVLAAMWWVTWRASPFLGWPRYYVAFLASRLLQRKRIAFFSVGAVTLCVAMMIIVISVMGGFVDSIRTRANGLLGDLVMDGNLSGYPYYAEFIDRIKKLRDDKDQPIVVQATPLIRTYGILQFPAAQTTKAVTIVGIRLNEYVQVNKFGEDLFYNNRYGDTTLGPRGQQTYIRDDKGIPRLTPEQEAAYERYLSSLPPEERAEEEKKYQREPGDDYPGPGVFKSSADASGTEDRELPGVILGRSIVFRRQATGDYYRSYKYPRGEMCYLTVLPLTRTGDVSTEPPPKPSFRYVDDSRTGIHEIDSVNVYVDFDTLQTLLSMEPMQRADGTGMAGARCSQIQIKLRPEYGGDRRELMRMRDLINEEWVRFADEMPADAIERRLMANVEAHTWEELQASFIAAIEKEKFLVLIMFGVISIVAIFLILCIFYMIVQEKTRDIGIIKSVGGSAAGVAAVFLAYGGAIGLVGCVLGGLLGTTFVEHINDVQDWLARLNPDWRVWSPETYSFDKIPDVWKWSEVIWISVLAVLASIAGATFPAVRAGRTWPVESLRYE